jgi:hypothetical protein
MCLGMLSQRALSVTEIHFYVGLDDVSEGPSTSFLE